MQISAINCLICGSESSVLTFKFDNYLWCFSKKSELSNGFIYLHSDQSYTADIIDTDVTQIYRSYC